VAISRSLGRRMDPRRVLPGGGHRRHLLPVCGGEEAVVLAPARLPSLGVRACEGALGRRADLEAGRDPEGAAQRDLLVRTRPGPSRGPGGGR
jgi:hypothetical protein